MARFRLNCIYVKVQQVTGLILYSLSQMINIGMIFLETNSIYYGKMRAILTKTKCSKAGYR